MKSIEHFVPNGDGWQLSLFQSWDESKLVPGRPPVLIVPGYGMNSFIFSFHPRGLSMEGSLVDAGLEVWGVNVRAQGQSTFHGTSNRDHFYLADLSLTDLPAAIEAVLANTNCQTKEVD